MDSDLKVDNNTTDPWFSSENVIAPVNQANKFEDNFNSTFFEKLPDSDEYLALLGKLFLFTTTKLKIISLIYAERKLKKIKNNSNVLAQLAEKREACMQELLTNGSYREEDQHIDFENSATSLILKAIAPQKQALNQGELLELVKNDQLDSSSIKSLNNSSTEIKHIKETSENKI